MLVLELARLLVRQTRAAECIRRNYHHHFPNATYETASYRPMHLTKIVSPLGNGWAMEVIGIVEPSSQRSREGLGIFRMVSEHEKNLTCLDKAQDG